MPTTVSRPRSPTVAEELGNLAASFEQLDRAAGRRANILSVWPGGRRYTFEDGSCITFNDAEQSALIQPNCED